MDSFDNEMKTYEKKFDYYKRKKIIKNIYNEILIDNEIGGEPKLERDDIDDYSGIVDMTSAGNYKNYLETIINMYEGKIEFNKNLFLKISEGLYNHEIVNILKHDDYYNLCNDKDFILDFMEHTGAILEISCFISKDVIKEIFKDKELLKRIFKKEILTSSNLHGEEILSILLLQLAYRDVLTQDKKFMIDLLENTIDIEEFNFQNNVLFSCINHVLVYYCKTLFQEKEFSEKVYKFLEEGKNKINVPWGWVVNKSMKDLSETMVENLEGISDEAEAQRYVDIFRNVNGIDKSLLENEEFMEIALDKCDDFCFEDIEIPLKFYQNETLLTKFLEAKAECDSSNGISFDFDNEQFTRIFENCFGVCPEEYMLEAVRYLLEKNNSIVIEEDESDDVVNILQQWAEDNDIKKIGQKLNVIRVPKGTIVEGELNIDNTQNIIKSENIFNKNVTVVLNGSNIKEILKKIEFDKHDMEKMSILAEISDLASQKEILEKKQTATSELLKQYEQLSNIKRDKTI